MLSPAVLISTLRVDKKCFSPYVIMYLFPILRFITFIVPHITTEIFGISLYIFKWISFYTFGICMFISGFQYLKLFSIQFNSNFIKIAKYILAHLIQNIYKHYNILTYTELMQYLSKRDYILATLQHVWL